jgi:prepilin-type processing-associated H-X9-DG protein
VALASLVNPATTISAMETKGINLSDAQAAWISCFTEPSRTFTDHLGTSNFLFLDGHVKALRPTATATATINMWTVSNATSVPSYAPGASAFMQSDMAAAEAAMPQSTAGSCP